VKKPNMYLASGWINGAHLGKTYYMMMTHPFCSLGAQPSDG